MGACNKVWDVRTKLFDFVVRSLYPSDMSMMGIPHGSPKVVNDCNYEFLQTQDYYVFAISLSKIYKHRAFLFIAEHTKDDVNWNDNEQFPHTTMIDKITLEDCIKFHAIEFERLYDYYWNEGMDYSANDLYKEIYNKRCDLKEEHNPLQHIYKLIMNRSYGKTI